MTFDPPLLVTTGNQKQPMRLNAYATKGYIRLASGEKLFLIYRAFVWSAVHSQHLEELYYETFETWRKAAHRRGRFSVLCGL